MLTNSGFNGVLAGDIRLQRRAVLFQFAMFEGISGGVFVYSSFVHHGFLLVFLFEKVCGMVMSSPIEGG